MFLPKEEKMNTLHDAFPGLEGIESLFSARQIGKKIGEENLIPVSVDIPKNTEAPCASVPKSFLLKEVVSAVLALIGGTFTRVTLEISNLCSEGLALVGSSLQLQGILVNALEGIKKSFQGTQGVIDVIIYELKRPSDGVFLMKTLFQDFSLFQEKKKICQELCSKYIAISMKKKFTNSSSSVVVQNEDEDKEGVSYFDGGFIFKKDMACVTVYLLKSETA
jgi:hypothetical protein